jgi:hypothetical protein
MQNRSSLSRTLSKAPKTDTYQDVLLSCIAFSDSSYQPKTDPYHNVLLSCITFSDSSYQSFWFVCGCGCYACQFLASSDCFERSGQKNAADKNAAFYWYMLKNRASKLINRNMIFRTEYE